MTITPRNLLRHELIGLKVKVATSSNPEILGVKGKVIDETRNTFIIETGGRRKTLIKDVSIFHVSLPDGTVVEVDGKRFIGRPEDRVKMRVRRW